MKLQYSVGAFSAPRSAAPAPKKTLAMAYIVDQEWRDLYETEKGFAAGTIFCELNFPFTERKGGGMYV